MSFSLGPLYLVFWSFLFCISCVAQSLGLTSLLWQLLGDAFVLCPAQNVELWGDSSPTFRAVKEASVRRRSPITCSLYIYIYIYIYMGKSSLVKRLYWAKVFVSFFDDYIFAGNRFQLVQGHESSFHALDLIVSQQWRYKNIRRYFHCSSKVFYIFLKNSLVQLPQLFHENLHFWWLTALLIKIRLAFFPVPVSDFW